jgi:hypothetical protein
VTSPRTLAVIASCALLLVAGCGEGEKVGGGVNTKITPGAGGTLIPGATTPPATKPGSRPSATRPPTTRPTAIRTTAKPTKAPTQAAAPTFVITINGDKSGKSLIDPPQASVYSGYRVIFKNADTKPHGVISDDGRINSGKCIPQQGITATCIQPGKSFTWIAGAPGQYAYKDSSRPYVRAQLLVAPR